MREKWNKPSSPKSVHDGQPVPQKITIMAESNMYRPKLLLKSPSMRAISNYHNLSIQDDSQNPYENVTFIPENVNVSEYTYNETYPNSNASNTNTMTSKNSVFPNDFYDFATLGTSSVKTTSHNGSELEYEKNEMGSTAKLVSSKMEMSCQTWFTHLKTVLCTISLAAGLGNIYRLPQTTLLRGGLPFLVAYVILTVLIGLPLLFLELGIGQLAQEGFIKSWRAVPFFRGIGYIKLIAGCLLSIYYPLYMGLSLYYIIWTSAFSLPFQECSIVKLKQTGYSADGINGQQCLKKTFLESPFEDPSWYGKYAGILFIVWAAVALMSLQRTKSFTRSLCFLLFPFLACLIALVVKAVFVETKEKNLEKMYNTTDWTILKNANVWYYAAIQVFFSTNVGFGTFVTNAGIMYNKMNPRWTALGYTVCNLLFGIGSVILCYILFGENSNANVDVFVPEVHLISLIYTVTINAKDVNDAKIWALVAFVTILLAGFISMATITYTLLKAITVQHKRILKWWQTSIVLSFAGLVLGCAVLLKANFQIVRLLDHYIVGNLIIISVIIEVFALIAFYGTERIKSDFEFMLGHVLSKIWLLLWWTLPLLLTGIFAWALITLPSNDPFINDPAWLIATGWAVVLISTIFIFIIGYLTIRNQDGYTFKDQFKASFKPSSKWGPKDPILRHNWIQWNSQAKEGERDFTLKRKGTREYTKSIKRNAKKAASDLTSNRTTLPITERIESNRSRLSTASSDYIEPVYLSNEQANYAQNRETRDRNPLRITSLVDTMDSLAPSYVNIRNSRNNEYKTNMNPMARVHDAPDSSNSEGYGTFRKGPFIIPDSNITHVCHRRFSQSEDATEL